MAMLWFMFHFLLSIKSNNYECAQDDCNQQFIFNGNEGNIDFYCDDEMDCHKLEIYYSGTGTLSVYCSQNSYACTDVKVYCGDWDPRITEIGENTQCDIYCESPHSPACIDVHLSCKGAECWMGAISEAYNIESAIMECNTPNFCQLDCDNNGCLETNLLCHCQNADECGESCSCANGNCDTETTLSYGIAYPFVSPTLNPTNDPSIEPTQQPSINSSAYLTENPSSASCGYIPDACVNDIEWALHTGRYQNPHWYLGFYEVTRVELLDAVFEDMVLYWVCTRVRPITNAMQQGLW